MFCFAAKPTEPAGTAILRSVAPRFFFFLFFFCRALSFSFVSLSVSSRYIDFAGGWSYASEKKKRKKKLETLRTGTARAKKKKSRNKDLKKNGNQKRYGARYETSTRWGKLILSTRKKLKEVWLWATLSARKGLSEKRIPETKGSEEDEIPLLCVPTQRRATDIPEKTRGVGALCIQPHMPPSVSSLLSAACGGLKSIARLVMWALPIFQTVKVCAIRTRCKNHLRWCGGREESGGQPCSSKYGNLLSIFRLH